MNINMPSTKRSFSVVRVWIYIYSLLQNSLLESHSSGHNVCFHAILMTFLMCKWHDYSIVGTKNSLDDFGVIDNFCFYCLSTR